MFRFASNCMKILIRKYDIYILGIAVHLTSTYRESIHRGWGLLCIISVTFPPSKNLEAYLTDFVQHHHHSQDPQVATMSQHVSNKLKRICKRGAKGKVLTSAEIARAKVILLSFPLLHFSPMLTFIFPFL